MPTIPFLSSFFGTSSSQKMSYPVQKTDEEWQAVLSKGKVSYPFSPFATPPSLPRLPPTIPFFLNQCMHN